MLYTKESYGMSINNHTIKDGKKMLLLELWKAQAYNQNADKNALQKLWNIYFMKEKEVYKQLLPHRDWQVTAYKPLSLS